MIDVTSISTRNSKQRVTQAEKDANDKQWYKDQCNLLDKYSFTNDHFIGSTGVTEYRRKKVNYDLFSNEIDMKDFQYVCEPFGAESGDLPANFTNRDIVSGKIKVLLGMEMKMPFSWKVIAVNEDATSRKEEEEFGQIRDYVVNEIMKPIKMQVQKEVMQQQNGGGQITPQQQQELQQQIAEETETRTPDQVRKYMSREHQDPAEMMAHQLLEYLIRKQRVADKFNKGWKHMNLAGLEVYGMGIINSEPDFWPVNPLFFEYDKSPDLDYIEDGEWCVEEKRMTPSEVIANLGSELTEDEIDKVYQFHNNPAFIYDTDFSFNTEKLNEPYTLRVVRTVWKSLKKIGFLEYMVDDSMEEKIVDENYRLNKAQGDISITWEWIPEAHECWKILSDIYVYARPVPGQHKDPDNLYTCKLPYYGAACDALNSRITSPMDRMKSYQYFYNVLIYRIELMLASDKGKILAANINAIPKSAGINLEQFMYFMEANKIAWLNPKEEGNKGQAGGDVTNLVKEIDMSLVSQIDKYITLAEYIERKCGDAIGVTKQMEGAIGPNEAVQNTRQNIVQSSHIIQPYFELHNNVKANVLTGLIETAKEAYAGGKKRKLSYVLDDMSIKMLTLDPEMFENSTYGLFVSNSSKAADAKQAVEGLAQAAMQNQQADLNDIIKVIRSESVTEAEELLEAAKDRKDAQAQAMDKAKMQQEQEQRKEILADKQADRDFQLELVRVKEEERRKTEIQKQAILSTGFDLNKDEDSDGIPDVLEIAKHGVDANIRMRKQALDETKFTHQQKVDDIKLKLEKEKINTQKAKNRTNG